MNKEQNIFIFVGRSGSGKGTQVDLFKNFLERREESGSEGKLNVFHLSTGDSFRKFIKSDSYSSSLARDIMNKGGLQPSFLAIWIWSQVFVDNIKGMEHVITDGFPRALNEAKILDTAISFYKKRPIVVYLKLSEESVYKRLYLRQRHDDHTDAIAERMNYFKNEVLPVIEYYRNNPDYTFVEIDGEPSIEEIHNDIVTKVSACMNS